MIFQGGQTERMSGCNRHVFRFLLGSLIYCSAAAAIAADLDKIHEWIADEYPQVQHLTTQQVAALRSDDWVIFDVREKAEFAVSHLAGAIRMDPETTADEFRALAGNALADKNILFYCSTGRRSSALADRISSGVNGEAKIYNLQNGIFGWHNERRPLSKNQMPTDYVHPYSWRWTRLLNRKPLIRYTPQ